MTVRHKLDRAEATLIPHNLEDMVAFFAEVIDGPPRADHIPTGSTLDFRNIHVRDQRLRLTAFRPSGSDAPWSARGTFHEPLLPDAGTPPPTLAPAIWEAVTPGETAAEAFDALEAALGTPTVSPR